MFFVAKFGCVRPGPQDQRPKLDFVVLAGNPEVNPSCEPSEIQLE